MHKPTLIVLKIAITLVKLTVTETEPSAWRCGHEQFSACLHEHILVSQSTKRFKGGDCKTNRCSNKHDLSQRLSHPRLALPRWMLSPHSPSKLSTTFNQWVQAGCAGRIEAPVSAGKIKAANRAVVATGSIVLGDGMIPIFECGSPRDST